MRDCVVFSILKSIEFSSAAGEEEGEAGTQGKSLETLLLEKNRALQTENTHLKVASTELTGTCSSLSLSPWLVALVSLRVSVKLRSVLKCGFQWTVTPSGVQKKEDRNTLFGEYLPF